MVVGGLNGIGDCLIKNKYFGYNVKIFLKLVFVNLFIFIMDQNYELIVFCYSFCVLNLIFVYDLQIIFF